MGTGKAPLARSLPAGCEDLTKRDPLPAVRTGQDARAALAEHRAALVAADARLEAVQQCEERQRAEYAEPPK